MSAARNPAWRAFRRFLEAAGPGFVKFGQVLSVRPDLLPAGLIRELERLQDRAPPVPFSRIARAVEGGLGAPPARLFRWFEPVPVASASVAQVHRAVLPGGGAVAVKVLRPGVERAMARNLALLGRCVRAMCALPPLRGRVDGPALWAEVCGAVRAELDLRGEAEAAGAMARNFRGFPGIRIPRVFWSHTSRRVLATEFVEGRKISDPSVRGRPEYRGLAERGARAFFKQVLEDGLFHADLHPANLLITPRQEIAYVDFGIRGRLSREERQAVLGTLAGLLARDVALAVRHLEKLGVVIPGDRREAFAGEVARLLDRVLQPRLADVPAAAVGAGILRAARRHGVRFPHRHAVLVKALLTIEGTARLLHPEFSFERAVRRYLLDHAARTATLGILAEALWRGTALLGLAALTAAGCERAGPPGSG